MNAGEATDRLVAFAAKAVTADLPPRVRAWAAGAVLDTLGVAVAARDAEGVVEARTVAGRWGGRPEATLWGGRDRVPAPLAALVNGTAARAFDFDDVFDAIPLHPSAALVPAAFAAAEATGPVSGDALVAAVAVGAEVMIRLGLARGATDPATGRPPLGRVLGPTVTAARLLGLDPVPFRHALGLAFTMASGELQSYDDGALTIRLQQGLLAETGVRAAVLAAEGMSGPWDFLEGRCGLRLVDGIEPERVVEDLGRVYHAPQTEAKPYPCCRCAHPAIDAALRLRAAHAVRREAIEGVRVEVGPVCAAVVAEPRDVRFNPSSVVEAQFSLPYTVATALATGDVGLSAFTPGALRDASVRDLMERVDVSVRRDRESMAEGMIGRARVEVLLASGRRVAEDGPIATGRDDVASGGAERKFAACMAAGGRGAAADRVLTLALTIDGGADVVARLVALLAED